MYLATLYADAEHRKTYNDEKGYACALQLLISYKRDHTACCEWVRSDDAAEDALCAYPAQS